MKDKYAVGEEWYPFIMKYLSDSYFLFLEAP